MISPLNLAQYIDHTLLKPEAKLSDFKLLCDEAKRYEFRTVCIPLAYVAFCASELMNHPTEICTVIGFPLGNNPLSIKLGELKFALAHGADEIDTVMNIGHLKEGKNDAILDELKTMVDLCGDKPLKVIIETALLTPEEIQMACRLIQLSKAAFVKTSTGFSHRGASLEDISTIKKSIFPPLLIKASGGIKTLGHAQDMIEAGADRLGTSSSVTIIHELEV